MNQGWTYCDRISKSAAGQTILSYYTQRYRHSTLDQWRDRIEQGQILLNGQKTHAHTLLNSGQQLTYHRAPWQEPVAPLTFDILHEDAHLWVIAKPSGLPVLPGGSFLEHTLLHQLRHHYPDEQPIPVHRLGRGTSGAMLIAKSQTARAHLARQFRIRSSPQDIELDRESRTLKKIYRALVGHNLPHASHFTCTYPIGKLPHHQLGYIYGHQSNGGRASRSDCTILQHRPKATLLDVSISTGRPHQIRIHLAAAGHPLLGDPLYPAGGIPDPDGNVMPGDCGYHLHAHQLRFIHPHTGHPISITAPPPKILSI